MIMGTMEMERNFVLIFMGGPSKTISEACTLDGDDRVGALFSGVKERRLLQSSILD
jgi:hypothetical protein